VCGEHLTVKHVRVLIDGSSPRVWGTLMSGSRIQPKGRFIPTCVGNTRYSHAFRRIGSVHPHVCGEHGITWEAKDTSYGSSPRVWGTLRRQFPEMYSHRFIPTCVGNTALICFWAIHLPVHPHVCGEHVCACPAPVCSIGSSPRVWGTPPR